MTVTRSCLRQEIRDTLMRWILEGVLKPGDRLAEQHLVREFETSPEPVREALQALEALGYLTTTPQGETRVREVPASEMRDAFRVRALLEREAAHVSTLAPAPDWNELRTAVDGIEAAARAGDLTTYVRNDEAFHRALVAASGNSVLLHHWDMLQVATRILVTIRSGILDVQGTAPEHRVILEALERRDSALAGELVFAHIDRVADLLQKRAADESPAAEQTPA